MHSQRCYLLFILNFPAFLPFSISCSLYPDNRVLPMRRPYLVGNLAQALVSSSRFGKCESFFLMDCHLANLKSRLTLFNSPFYFNSALSFLGVTFDRTLSFSKQPSSPNQVLSLCEILRRISAFL